MQPIDKILMSTNAERQNVTSFEACTTWTCTNMSPNQVFWNYWINSGQTVPSLDDQNRLNKFLSIKTLIQKNFKTFTCSPKPPKKQSDDVVYHEHPIFQTLLPRGMTLVFNLETDEFITSLTGPLKFSGNDKRDDDEGSGVVLFNMATSIKWVKDGQCMVIRTTKANGKFVIAKLFILNGRVHLIFGSKNVHHVTPLDELEVFLNTPELSDIVVSLGRDILLNQESILKLLPKFLNGWSIMGELEDGAHFTPGDDTVAWVSLFDNNGLSIDNHETIMMLRDIGLRTVDSDIVFSPGDSEDKFTKAFLLARCVEGEGDVLVIRNVVTGESMLCKSKSALYICWRAFREKWKGNPVGIFEKFPERICEISDYHGLNTAAAIRITKQLFDFAIWLGIVKGYPAAVLDHQPVETIRGVLPNGFNRYWRQFLTETETDSVTFVPDDFGEFNAIEYLSSVDINVFPESNNVPSVLFTQDIQGGGKSTIGTNLKNTKRVEQDWCYGCTKVTQFQLAYYLRFGNNVVVTRCNAEPKQYQTYLKIAQSYGARIVFATSNDMKSPLRLAVALAGIKNRSEEGDKVMVGRKEYPFPEVVGFTTEFWNKFKAHDQAVVIPSFRKDADLAAGADNALKTGTIIEFIEGHVSELMSLRLPLDDVVKKYQTLIDSIPEENLVSKSLKDTVYIGLHLIPSDERRLITCIKELDTDYINKDKIVCQHVTQVYIGKKGISPVPTISEGEVCTVVIDALVINNTNGASAFRVSAVRDLRGMDVPIGSRKPHITAVLANGSKPADSSNFVFSQENVTIISVDMTVTTICRWN